MDIEKLHDVFDGARYVRVDKDLQVIFVWCGGATVNLYSADGTNYECYTNYDLNADNIAASVTEHIAEMQGVCPECGCTLDEDGDYCSICAHDGV